MEPADTDDVAAADDGEVAGTVQLPDGDELPVTLDADLVERAQAEGVDIDRLRDAAVPSSATVDLTAQTDGDSTATIPVQDRRQTDLTSRRKYDRQYQFIDDDQIRRLIRNSVDYTERVGHFLLARDDLIPTVKERLKALIIGEDGLGVEPADPDSDADQRLADHLQDLYEDDVRPTNVIDSILRENMMNARAVLRATDLAELDLSTLDYLRDGISGEEIYVQDRTTVYEFDIDEQPNDGDTDTIGGIDLDTRTIDSQALIIGEHVFDISLYDTPPLEAVADTAVNKMVLQRLKARKAEITSFGAVYAKVKPPSYLPEDQYFDRVADDDWDGDGEPPTKLERALEQNIQNAFDTLKDFQSGTVMSVPDFWELEQLDIPETDDPIDDQIRGYNRDISRRLLVPLDLIELQSGSELSRETMFATLMTTIAGWRREIKRVFDQFAEVQAEIEGISGDVDHTFPPLKDANAKQVISALQYAGVAGLSQKEVRQMMNTVQGIDLETDDGAATQPPQDGSAPPEGGPDDPSQRTQQMRDMLDEQRRGQNQDSQQAAQAGGQGNVTQAGDAGTTVSPATTGTAAGSGGPTDKAAAILRSVPFLPDPQGDQPVQITKNQLGDWLAWVRAGRPDLQAADWNPALHPRGPDGKFVERPYDIPDDVVSEIRSSNGPELLRKLEDAGELNTGDLNALLSDDAISIDDVPDDIDSARELEGVIRRGGSKARPSLSELEPQEPGDRGENWVSTMDAGSLQAGDAVLYREDAPRYEREGPDIPARVIQTGREPNSGGNMIIETQDGRRIKNPNDVEHSGTGIVGVYQPGDRDRLNPDEPVQDPSLLDVSVDDPRFTTNFDTTAPREGDIVRIDPSSSGLEQADRDDPFVAEITERRYEGAEFTVETQDGETLDVGAGEPYDVDALLDTGDGDDVANITADDFQTLDDVETVDLTERSGSPAERRQGVDQGELLTDDPIPAEMVENEEIPEGALIARESDGRFTIGRVTGYSESITGDKEIEFTTAYGRTHTERAERVENRGYRPYKPRAKAEVTIDGWGDDDTALAKRKEAVRDVLDQVVPAYQNHDEVNDALGDIPIEDGNFDRVKDQVADHLARAKDKEHAETVIARLSAIGDDKSRASASPDVSAIEENRTRFQVEPEDSAKTKTDHHEMGHSVGMAYGFRGGSNDKDGETYPVTNFAWNSPDFDVPDKYGMPMRPAADGFEDDTSLRNQPMYQQGDDWTSEVERQVGTGLDGRNFTNVDGLDDLDISEGSMIQLRDEPSYGDPRIWRFADVREPGDDDPFAEAAVTLEAKDGTTQEATIETGAGGQPRIDWADSADYLTFEDIQRSRKSTPDDWREDPPDADDWLGQDDDTADPDSKMATLADRVNKAWYRQAVAAREQDDDRASRYVIKDGYSSKQGHETMSRIHEVMRKDDISASTRAKAAQTLVRYHPDLLEAYRALYDIPANMKVTLNHVLEHEGHDFRFEGAPMMDPPGDLANPAKEAVDDLYENGGDA